MSKVVISVANKLVQKVQGLLEYAWFVSPKKSPFSVWHEDRVLPKFIKAIDEDDKDYQEMMADTLSWGCNTKVRFSGVFVVSNAKFIMNVRLKSHRRHPDSRKAIVCTRNYRPFKYPGGQSFLFFLSCIRKILIHQRKKSSHDIISGNVALLGNCAYENDNYYHFWADVITDIWYIRQHLKEEDLPDYYVTPHANMPWQWDILKLCGVNKSQVISYAKYDVSSIEKLIIPVRDKGAYNLPPWLCRAMHDMCGWSPKLQKGERLIYVSRADADRRRISNEEILRSRLQEVGFEIHTLNGLSIDEQQQLFASAAIICAPHGAALTNLVWCGPEAVIIDLLSDRYLIPCFRQLAAQNKLFYYAYACRQLEGVKSGLIGDIIVSETQIESVLDVVSRHAVHVNQAENII
ncbi:glycosyltransferase family 61 protein [Halomonas sp. NO4]|uniref:glycosyltransferase family 61 protein n=1 Tax=Halomonas sp. NO4 TaxID=2484813 RepID=UPI0013CFA617|nr:glycosyltransferase family 61 protein [Halomonas sp. NO4]